jgi:hypothetical protein
LIIVWAQVRRFAGSQVETVGGAQPTLGAACKILGVALTPEGNWKGAGEKSRASGALKTAATGTATARTRTGGVTSAPAGAAQP